MLRTLPAVALGAAVFAFSLQGAEAASIDFGLLLPAIEARLGDGSVVPLPTITLDNFRTEVQGDGSVRIALANPIVVADVLSIDTIDATYDFDPFIDASVGVTVFLDTAVTFSFLFGSPYVGAYDTLGLTGSASVTDAGRDGAALGQVSGGDIMTGGAAAAFPAPDLIGLGTGCSFGDENPGGTEQCFDLTETIAGSFGDPGVMQLELNFIVSPDGDSASLTGKLELSNAQAVAEPTTLALLGLPLGLLALRRRA
jgi:hypothetical protein